MKTALAAILLCALTATSPVSEQERDLSHGWETFYEASGRTRTPDYETTVAYCRRLADASPWVHYRSFGISPQGRELPLLIVDRGGNFTPASVRATDNVVFLVQGGIHSGEIDGKDAGLMLVRDMAITRERANLLDHVTVLFIPVFNVDGHERSGPYNRINQNGPEEMGWRVNAANLNLNRDYLKADTPEMRAWLALYREWLPEFFADCHVTDGADYRYAVTYALEIDGSMVPGLTDWTAKQYLPPLEKRMNESGFPIIRYQWYRTQNDPRSGILGWVAPPRFSEGYTSIQNRPGLLIETHSLKDYATRVEGTYQMLAHTIGILGTEHKRLRTLVAEADRLVASSEFRSQPYPLTFAMSEEDSVMLEFLGYDYEFVESDLTGGAWPRFSDRPMTIQIPYFNTQKVTASALLPEAYIIPPEWDDVIARLAAHGIAMRGTEHAVTIPVESYRFHHAEWQSAPFEGRHPVTFELEAETGERAFPRGSAVVDMNQRAALVAAHMLEPKGPDSFVFWGFFDAVFEQKEYVESYVIERLAREMLENDPALAAEFESWRAENADAEPDAVRAWFYQRSPYWDREMNLYPVGRIMDRATLTRALR